MSNAPASIVSRLAQSRLIWPLAGLALLLFFNLAFDRAFFDLSTRDGNLYGPMITVLRLAVKVMLLATGMTLVIATGGVDLSVGSVMAIVGALVAFLAERAQLGFPGLLAVALGAALIIGLFNGALIAGGKFTSAGGSPVGHIARWDEENFDSHHALGFELAGDLQISAAGFSAERHGDRDALQL